VPLLTVVEQEPAELEFELLIREARHRQWRRRRRRALVGVSALVVVAGALAAATDLLSSSAGNDGGRQTGASATACSASPAEFVSNSVFAATVIGTGRVRLGIGNVYEQTRRRVVVRHAGARSWGGIEAIWWLADADVRGPITVRGVALDRQGPIEVQPSDGGLAPGSGALTLQSNFQSAPNASAYPTVYPGSLWVRRGGCYAVDLSARGFSERIVIDVLLRPE
jgi:hypothetical protein